MKNFLSEVYSLVLKTLFTIKSIIFRPRYILNYVLNKNVSNEEIEKKYIDPLIFCFISLFFYISLAQLPLSYDSKNIINNIQYSIINEFSFENSIKLVLPIFIVIMILFHVISRTVSLSTKITDIHRRIFIILNYFLAFQSVMIFIIVVLTMVLHHLMISIFDVNISDYVLPSVGGLLIYLILFPLFYIFKLQSFKNCIIIKNGMLIIAITVMYFISAFSGLAISIYVRNNLKPLQYGMFLTDKNVLKRIKISKDSSELVLKFSAYNNSSHPLKINPYISVATSIGLQFSYQYLNDFQMLDSGGRSINSAFILPPGTKNIILQVHTTGKELNYLKDGNIYRFEAYCDDLYDDNENFISTMDINL